MAQLCRPLPSPGTINPHQRVEGKTRKWNTNLDLSPVPFPRSDTRGDRCVHGSMCKLYWHGSGEDHIFCLDPLIRTPMGHFLSDSQFVCMSASAQQPLRCFTSSPLSVTYTVCKCEHLGHVRTEGERVGSAAAFFFQRLSLPSLRPIPVGSPPPVHENV